MNRGFQVREKSDTQLTSLCTFGTASAEGFDIFSGGAEPHMDVTLTGELTVGPILAQLLA